MSTRRIAVVGAGVIGLSSAVCILETVPGVDVTIIAEEMTPNTTSDGAFGLWEPHAVSDTPLHKIREWGDTTFHHMLGLARSPGAANTGSFLLSTIKLCQSPTELPVWKDTVLGFRPMTDEELKLYPTFKYGWSYTTVATECKWYLPWLTRRFVQKGGQIIQKRVKQLTVLSKNYDVVVNCTGLGSKYLLQDEKVFPMRGQVIRVRAPWIKRAVIDDHGGAHILPGTDSVLLGGTHGKGECNLKVSQKTKEKILTECQSLEPSLQRAELIRDWVGLRPGRTSVRVEAEITREEGRVCKVVHNYGHGGAGIVLHWGCAVETRDLVRRMLEGNAVPRL